MGGMILIVWQLAFGMGQNDFEIALRNPTPNPHAIQELQKYNYFFVAGFLNEFVTDYFGDNRDYLQSHGVNNESIHIFYPSSNGSLYQNADGIYIQLKRLSQTSSKKWVVIAHSKGGFESLLFATKYKDFFLENVEKLHLVQAAFGSPLADFASGGGHEINGEMPFLPAWNCRVSMGLRYLLDHQINRGIYALTSTQVESTLEHLYTYYSANITAVENKIFYTVSESTANEASYLLYCPSYYLETYYSESDGMILKENQSIERIGRIWAELKLDHTDLTLPFPYSNTRAKYRYAFMKLIAEDL
jgi:pimeloyl-ACP methyl ester carboxylesterase